jgi:hypothetical protein
MENLRHNLYTGCPRVEKKLHNLPVTKDINFHPLPDDSHASTAHSENIESLFDKLSNGTGLAQSNPKIQGAILKSQNLVQFFR